MIERLTEIEHPDEERVDIIGLDAVIDQAGADRELSPDGRGRRRGDPPLMQLSDDIGIEPIGIGTTMTEADDVERGRRQQLQARLGCDAAFEIARQRAAPGDLAPMRSLP